MTQICCRLCCRCGTKQLGAEEFTTAALSLGARWSSLLWHGLARENDQVDSSA